MSKSIDFYLLLYKSFYSYIAKWTKEMNQRLSGSKIVNKV